MKVLITGGAGNVGDYVVNEIKPFHDVTILDTKKSVKHSELPILIVDLTREKEALDSINGFDAVIHLAAIPNPSKDPGERVLSVNVTSTYNLMEAVRKNNISKVIYACSESASGFGIHNVLHIPKYLPIDEEHPSWPHESYSFSKYFGEIICREYAHAYQIQVVSLRYGWVWRQEDKEAYKGFIQHVHANNDETLGAYVVANDVAQAFRLSLDYDLINPNNFESFYITAADNYHLQNAFDQIIRLFPKEMPSVDAEYFAKDPHRSFYNIEKAEKLLGYTPKYTWRDMI